MDVAVTRWAVHSETGQLHDVLLCPPAHYEWLPTNDIARRALGQSLHLDRQAMLAQYREFEDALQTAGVTCHYLAPEPQLPYQVYTRDSSQVTPWGAMLTQLERPQRRGEVAAILSFYGQSGAGFWQAASAGCIEGGDIHVIGRGLMAIGHSGARTEYSAAEQLASWFREKGWEAILVPFPEHFLHLDVIFSMVGDRLALACADVLDQAFLDWLAHHGIRLIEVSYKEAMHDMACNVLALGRDRIISPRHCRRVNEVLRAEGFGVLDPHLNLFARGGGSVHCMTMPLRRDAI